MRIFIILSTILLYSTSLSAQLLGGSCKEYDNCSIHGKCIDGALKDTFWCRCDNGYGGDFCERECNLNCDDRKKCVFDADGLNPKCLCKDCINKDYQNLPPCPKGFGGGNCKTPLPSFKNPCDANPCNNGRCYPFNGGFQCVCNNGYGGSYCEKGNDHCAQNSCRKGSHCVNTANGYYCECPPGKTGQFCEKSDCTLLGNICNHGKCINSFKYDKNFECECDDGYEGEFCTQDRNECLDKYLCVNNGTCINLAGGFVCNCKPGFIGRFCEETVNQCKAYTCKNGGECGRMPDESPVCICKQGFTGKRCETKCPPGFGGFRCDLPRNKPHCSRNNGTCFNGGRCIYGFCKCPPAFIGDRCELDRNTYDSTESSTCETNPCMNNATCVDVDGGHSCICHPGFYGPSCERQIQCAPTTCANGGNCTMHTGVLTCKCPLGFFGDYCERPERLYCSTNPCVNGGICNRYGNNGVCECPYGFAGPRCQLKLDMEEPKEKLVRNLCKQRNCSVLAGDGICNPECNLEECNFDGGDCSGGQKPFSECLYPSRCADLFANGVCNQECNNEKCLYDGMDCQSELYQCPENIREHCIKRRGNGICDRECSFIGCGFDGGDCANETGALILSDIKIKVQIDPLEFQSTGGDILMDISARLRATVRIQKDEFGPLVFKWDGENEMERVEMDSKQLSKQLVLSHHVRKYRNTIVMGIVLYLEVVEICKPTEKCRFSTAQSVVDMIAAGLVKSNGRTFFGLPVMEAMVATPRRNQGVGGWSRNQILLVAVIAFLAFGTVVAGIVAKTNEPERSRKRKMVTAPCWMPPLDPAVEKAARRYQSNHSSQCSLLDNSAYLTGAKRQRADFEVGYDGQYDQIYPQTLANGFTGEFAPVSQQVINVPHEPVKLAYVPAILLHVQAAGPGPITEPITEESVNQADKYRRGVLHWLADNVDGKPEDMITSETVMCLDAGADVNARDCDENTPLMLAVYARRVRLAVILMNKGANPTIFNNAERSALHVAVVNKDLRMMTNLLTDKRLLNEIDELDRNGFTALMHTANSYGDCQVEMAKLLLAKGAKLDADGVERKESDKYHGRTALHYAALSDNLEMVQFLVSQNSNKDKQDEAGQTPIMLAAKSGHERTVKFLVLKGASLTTVDLMNKTADQLAEANFHHEIAAYLLKMSTDRNRNELLRQQKTGSVSSKSGRQTLKAVKRAGSRKMPSSTVSSRESNHLTPPPSDGSFSSPSPHYFQTSSSTPTGMESSPEHVYNYEMAAVHPVWYPTPPPYPDSNLNHMPTSTVFRHGDQMNGFYC